MYIPLPPYSKPADLSSFEMSNHEVLVLSPPNSFSASPSYPFNRGPLRIFLSRMILQLMSHSQGVGDGSVATKNLPIMNFYRSTNRQPHALASIEPCHHPATCSPDHNLETGRMCHKVLGALGHACAKEFSAAMKKVVRSGRLKNRDAR